MINCPTCNVELTASTGFCGFCGASVSEVTASLPERSDAQMQPQQSSPYTHSHPNQVLGVRSGTVLFNCLFGWIAIVPSVILTLLFFMYEPFLGMLFLLADVYSFVMLLYFTIELANNPKTRIELKNNSLIINVNRSRTETVSLSEITMASATGGNWFLNGVFWMADGTVTITTQRETFRLKFVRQSLAVAAQIESFRRPASIGYNSMTF